ncbi:uncharacterized protein YcbK (DUF882 family) [Microbacterium resistens]|uniref:Uncharacterized protein YcbK (DUF882 family) n=1 Tax=Microbacterium resistens TaxID=156977 RepID=A0ABU1SBE5_9MICO|nr:M15 family metallopeptidase [Microbacterium resistens]MDR6866930.1 uncharacterized protein YcbK (DUF882 family) [Microbacterium resistens]
MSTNTPQPRRLWAATVIGLVALLGAGTVTAISTAAAASRPSAPHSVDTVTVDEAPTGTGEPTAADGFIADGDSVSPFDGSARAVTRLDPALLDALHAAASAAKDDGVSLRVASGWRAPAYQAWLLTQAVRTYGSEEEAGRWVGTPETSRHVAGEAVDIGPYDSADWLDRKGAAFGLCRTYDNEKWHFEHFPQAVDEGCPPMYPDFSQDPRVQR